MPKPSILVCLALLVAVAGAAGCGGKDKAKSKGDLGVNADANPFTGPAPVTIKFTSSAKGNQGDVRYRWRFDDGTMSTEKDPVHSFPRPGYYGVVVDVFDESGNNARQSLLVSAWPPKEWATAQVRPLTKQRALNSQKGQQQRTSQRVKEFHKVLRKRLAAELQQ